MPSPFLYTCLSVRPTFALSRKKKRIPDRRLSARNNWSRCDFVIDIRSGRSIGLLTLISNPCDWHFDSDTSGLNIPEDRKKIEFWALASPASSKFPERDGLLFYLLSFCKNEYHPFPPLPFCCQNVHVYVSTSFLLSLFVYQIYRNNETNYSFFRCFVNANTLPKLIVTQSWP